ncbi:MAG: ATP-dependent DNA ligase [Lacibacter sp.]
MKAFATLIQQLGTGTGVNDRKAALERYFRTAPDADKIWVLALFTGRRPKRLVRSTLLHQWCREVCGIPQWLFEECYHTVGDLAETIALLLPETATNGTEQPLHVYMQQLLQLQTASEAEKKSFVINSWLQLNSDERFAFNKLLTGGFRIGVSQQLITQALAQTLGMPPSTVAHRISGRWNPATTRFDALFAAEKQNADPARPYPFYLAYALETPPGELGPPSEWQAEWKWDGIRGQLIKRNNELFVWSRGEELITEKFPEYLPLLQALPNGVALDGEIVSMHAHAPGISPLPFSALQTRISRKQVTKKQLQQAPAAFIAYDLLEWQGNDIRQYPLLERRKLLEHLIAAAANPVLRCSPLLHFTDWDSLAQQRLQARENGSEGLMLKRKSAPYQTGRRRGDWWKWKLDPLVIDGILIYAQKGHGRRSNLFTDYTFAVRHGEQLVAFAKAYSGLTDAELAEVDAFVKRNALEKFGPVRTVKPELVFEIAFEGIAASSRHKSGVALRFPRINRWRKDKTPAEANTLDDLQQLLQLYGS